MALPQVDADIDFVVLWVDASDPETDAARTRAVADERAAGRPVADGPNRHRDNGELLFLLRAIEANMPWYRRIYIVTNGQRPAYVDFSSDSVRLVSHAEIFPANTPLPAFNTFAIDACLARIDGLSDTFVRFSDDFFVCRPVARRAFRGLDGFGRHLVGEKIFSPTPDTYFTILQRNAVRLWEDFGFMPTNNTLHAPQLRQRSVVAAMEAQWPDWFAATRRSRFRAPTDLNVFFLYPYFAAARERGGDLATFFRTGDAPGLAYVHGPDRHQRIYTQITAGVVGNDWRAALNRVSRNPTVFLNINDDFGDTPSPQDVEYVGEQLCRILPRPSRFEINPDRYPGYAAVAAKRLAAPAPSPKGSKH